MQPLLITTVATIALIGATTVAAPYFVTTEYTASTYQAEEVALVDTADEPTEPVFDDRPVVQHQPLPEQVKAIYMTSCVAGTPSFRSDLIELMQTTEINTVVIDVKDYSGTISFPPESEELKPAWQAAKCGTSDMRDLVAKLHENDIYVVARITVFQDPYFTGIHPELAVKRADGITVWKDYKGLSFVDVGAQAYWDYIINLSKDTYNLGFDELNFDYVRYPSDGPMKDIAFTLSKNFPGDDDQQANLESFFRYLNEKLDNEDLFSAYRHENTGRASSTPWTSVDLFGMTTTNFDDLSIGQVQDRAAPYFDFVAPMVYPSHYPDSFLGLGDPNKYPYKVVHYAMKSGVDRMTSSTTPMQGFLHTPIMKTVASSTPVFSGQYTKPVYTADKFRTWIQDFDYGGDYDAEDVRAQIQASYDAGVNSWMIWAPSNRYTASALYPADGVEVTAAQ